jgi:hypothetical protein
MFSQGYTKTVSNRIQREVNLISEDPSLEHFDHIVVKLPINDHLIGTSIIWRCQYCKFEIDHQSGQFIPEIAREHLSQCESDWIDPDIVQFFIDEIESLKFASICFPQSKSTTSKLISASVSNSLHSTSYSSTQRTKKIEH